MILVKSVIVGNWANDIPEVQYTMVLGWAQARMVEQDIKEVARTRTQSLHDKGATGRYITTSTLWSDDNWKDLTLADLPGIPLAMLKRVLDYIPEYHPDEVEA